MASFLLLNLELGSTTQPFLLEPRGGAHVTQTAANTSVIYYPPSGPAQQLEVSWNTAVPIFEAATDNFIQFDREVKPGEVGLILLQPATGAYVVPGASASTVVYTAPAIGGSAATFTFALTWSAAVTAFTGIDSALRV